MSPLAGSSRPIMLLRCSVNQTMPSPSTMAEWGSVAAGSGMG
jgi:hypothetical protein